MLPVQDPDIGGLDLDGVRTARARLPDPWILYPVSGLPYSGVMNADRWKNPDTDLVVGKLLHVTDEEMAAQQPMVRALVIQRLEAVYRACEPHMNGEVFPPDVRYVILAERVLKQMSGLYRLQEWSSAPRDLEIGADERVRALEAVDRGLAELEAKQGG